MSQKMMRNNQGKPKLSFILDFPNALKEVALIGEGGAITYEKYNWKQGAPISEIEDSLLRHLTSFHNCEDDDVESQQSHLGHVIFNAAVIIEHLEMYGGAFDDRDWENAK